MKTAMQELIDEVRRLRRNGFSVDDKYLQGLLEKEKEGIVCAWNDSKVSMMSGEQYFEETYNQSK